MSIWSSINFHLVKFLTRNKYCRTTDKVLYLTFDDGPEPDITGFILDILSRHRVKATFFCCGKQAEMYPELIDKIRDYGHTIANHTYSHINGLHVNSNDYYADIERANVVLRTSIFRPPWGSLTLREYMHLKKQYKIVLWNVTSDDCKNKVDIDGVVQRMCRQMKGGDVILFHFVERHSENTKAILPKFIDVALRMGYYFQKIEV